MASTNKTPNIHLSQFVASDKPAWLTDYNNDMRAIDEAVASTEQGVPKSMDSWKKITVTHPSFTEPFNAVYWNETTKTLCPHLYSIDKAVNNQAVLCILPDSIPRPSTAITLGQYIGMGFTSATPSTSAIPIPASLALFPDGSLKMSLSVATTLYRVTFFTPTKFWHAIDGDRVTDA